jgi:hypothetical protein
MGQHGMQGLGSIKHVKADIPLIKKKCGVPLKSWPGGKGFVLPDGTIASTEPDHNMIMACVSDETSQRDEYRYTYKMVNHAIQAGLVRIEFHHGPEITLAIETTPGLTDGQRRTLSQLAKESGLVWVDLRDTENGKELVDYRRFNNPRPGEVVNYIAGGQGLGKVSRPELTDEVFKRASRWSHPVDNFNPHDAGFILPDGTLVRVSSHEDIYQVYPDEIASGFRYDYDAVYDVIERGAIRTFWDGDDNAIVFDIHKKPTAQQNKVIREMSTWPDMVWAEVSDMNRGTHDYTQIPIFRKGDANKVVKWLDEKGYNGMRRRGTRGLGVGVTPYDTSMPPKPPRPQRCDSIEWQHIDREMLQAARLYGGAPLPQKPKAHKKCVWALEVALGKYEEATEYRERGQCELAGEYGLDAIRYHGMFINCQLNQERAAKKKKKKKTKKKAKKKAKRKR